MKALLPVFLLFSLTATAMALPDDSLPKVNTSRFLVFPFIIRSPETDWGFGGAAAFFFKAGKNHEGLRTSDINLLSLYTSRKQTVIVLGSTIFFPGEKEIFRFQGSYSYYPDRFWGIGNNSNENMKADYSLKQSFINPQFIINFYRKFFTGISLEWQDINNFEYNPGSVFDSQKITGRNGGVTLGAGFLLTFDTRNNAYSPSHGTFVEMNITRFSENFKSNFNFTSYLLDIRKFLLIKKSTVLGFQSILHLNEGNAPLRYLSMLGGTEMMRGYYKGRFTDKNQFAIQSEIRQSLFWRIGIAGFFSAGQVSSDVNSFKLNEFHFAYGAGCRLLLQKKEQLNLRVDFGFGKSSHGIYVILKEAF